MAPKNLHLLRVTSDCTWRNTYSDFQGNALKVTRVPLWNPLRIAGFLEKALCDILQALQLPGGPMDLPALGLENSLGGGYQPWSPSWLAASPLGLALIGDHPWLGSLWDPPSCTRGPQPTEAPVGLQG